MFYIENQVLQKRKRKHVEKFSCHTGSVEPQIDVSLYIGKVKVITKNSYGEEVLYTNTEEELIKPERKSSDYSLCYKRLSKIYLLNAFPFLMEQFVDEQLKKHNYNVLIALII